MNRLRQEREPLILPIGSAPPEKGRLVKTGFLSLFFHLVLILFIILNLMPAFNRGGPKAYRVTLHPFSPPGDGNPPGGSSPNHPGVPGTPESPSTPLKADKSKFSEGPKQSETRETKKLDQKKTERAERKEVPLSVKKEKKYEQSREDRLFEGLKKAEKKEKKVEEERGSGKSLQDAIEDIHKKVALDELQKKVARRSGTEKEAAEGPSSSTSQGSGSSSSRSSTLIGSGTGTGTGSGSGTGLGSGGSPWGSSLLESRLNDYYSMIWAKIKEGWTLPENLPKEKTDLEAVIVVIIEKGGKVQKSWFEKRSGNSLYDQMAMRAIRKAEPLPPIPKELGDDTLEIGIRFHPE